MASVLEGIRVIDVSQVAAVPMCARHLSDFGADVIHVEHPRTGDSWRAQQGGVPSDFPYNWENFNRNKRGMTLNLASETGQKVLHRLVRQADVLVTNLRLWEQRKFRVGYDVLREINPRLVYGSVTGFGKKGPDNESPAYDITAFWGRAGVTQMLTPLGMSGPTPRAAVGDVVAGLGLAFGVMAALYHRQHTGVGQEVDISLFHTGIYQASFDASGAAAAGDGYEDWRQNPPGEEPERRERRLQLMAESQAAIRRLAEFYMEMAPNPLAGHYITRDGRRLIFNAMHSDRYWAPFCRAIGREDLVDDPRYRTADDRAEHNIELRARFAEVFRTRTMAEWLPLLQGLPFSPLQNLSEVVRDPQAVANDVFPWVEHPVYGRRRVIASPVNLSESPATMRTAAPEFSQHTEEILLEAGYSWEEIAGLKEQGVIA